MRLVGYDSDSVYRRGDFARLYAKLAEGLPKGKKKHSGGKAKRSGGFCCYCELELTRLSFSWDHLYPKSLGGRIKKPCCRKCNAEKRDMTLEQYLLFIKYQRIMLPLDSLGYSLLGRKLENIKKLMILKPDRA